MAQYDGFAYSVQGYNHKKVDKECQDASCVYCDDVMSVIVVADGHGSDNYPRTACGSKFAVEETVDSIKSFVRTLNELQVSLDVDDDRDKQLTDLAKNILLNWHDRVDEDVKERPFTLSEVEKVSGKYKSIYLSDIPEEQDKKAKAYGSTLIAVCITSSYWFGLQIGDGKCVSFNKNLDSLELIPWDDSCQGEVTTSICDSNAIDEFRFYKSKDLPLAVFVGCDGVDDSYSCDADLYNLYRSILQIFAEYGSDKGRDEVQTFLPSLSQKGSGDDVSIAGLICGGILKDTLNLIKAQTEYENATASLDRLEKELRIAQEKVEYISLAMQKTRETLTDTEEKLKKAQEECEANSIKTDEAKKRFDKAYEALRLAREVFNNNADVVPSCEGNAVLSSIGESCDNEFVEACSSSVLDESTNV